VVHLEFDNGLARKPATLDTMEQLEKAIDAAAGTRTPETETKRLISGVSPDEAIASCARRVVNRTASPSGAAGGAT
jgi:hypothetical protein